MSLQTTPVNHSLANGDFESQAIQADASHVAVAVTFDGIIVDDVSCELHQSIDGVNWGVVKDSAVTLNSGQTSQQYTIVGIVACSFLKVIVNHGSAVSGTVTNFKVLTSRY